MVALCGAFWNRALAPTTGEADRLETLKADVMAGRLPVSALDEATAATPVAPGEGVAGLAAAARRLEEACNKRAALLTREAYLAAEGIAGMREVLDELDSARKAVRVALSNPAPVAAPAQMAVNAIAALAPVELEGFPYAGRFRCQQCRFEWGGDLGSEGHATNCAYAIATSVAHTPAAVASDDLQYENEHPSARRMRLAFEAKYGRLSALMRAANHWFNVRTEWNDAWNRDREKPITEDDVAAAERAMLDAAASPGDSADAPVQQAGHCERLMGCVCGGDLPLIRERCGNWVKGGA